jgi:hypothetical protein
VGVSDYGEAIDEIRAAYAEAMPDFMPDVCTVSVPGEEVNNGDGATTEGTPTTIEYVPCKYETLSAYERVTAGAVQSGATHSIELPYSWQGVYLDVPASATIEVEERGPNPARSFAVTGALPSSTELKQRVAATLKG